jgi:hypothetical protein
VQKPSARVAARRRAIAIRSRARSAGQARVTVRI